MSHQEPNQPNEQEETLSAEELRAQTAEPLPDREVMSTLLVAPGPPTFSLPIDIDGDST
jgi:hypothetical protein